MPFCSDDTWLSKTNDKISVPCQWLWVDTIRIVWKRRFASCISDWNTRDVFDLDKIGLWDDSEDFLIQDADATGDYYFKITPVTYANSQWNVETSNTVTIADTSNYYNTGYIDLTSNANFEDINYAIIETESALISDVYVTY